MGQCTNLENSNLTARDKLSEQKEDPINVVRAAFFECASKIVMQMKGGSAVQMEMTNWNQYCSLVRQNFSIIFQVNDRVFVTKCGRIIYEFRFNSLSGEDFLRACQYCLRIKRLSDRINEKIKLGLVPNGSLLSFEEFYLRKIEVDNQTVYVMLIISKPYFKGFQVISFHVLMQHLKGYNLHISDQDISLIVHNIRYQMGILGKLGEQNWQHILISGQCKIAQLISEKKGSQSSFEETLPRFFSTISKNQKSFLLDRKYKETSSLLKKDKVYFQHTLQLDHLIQRKISDFLEHYFFRQNSFFHENLENRTVRFLSYGENYQKIRNIYKDQFNRKMLQRQINGETIQIALKLLNNYNLILNTQNKNQQKILLITEKQVSSPTKKKSKGIIVIEKKSDQKVRCKTDFLKQKQQLEKHFEEISIKFIRRLQNEGELHSLKHWLQRLFPQYTTSYLFGLTLSGLQVQNGDSESAETILDIVLGKHKMDSDILEKSLQILMEINLERAVNLLQTYQKYILQQYKYEYYMGKILLLRALLEAMKSQVVFCSTTNKRQQIQRNIDEKYQQMRIHSDQILSTPKIFISHRSHLSESKRKKIKEYANREKYLHESNKILRRALNRTIDCKQYLIWILETLGDVELYQKNYLEAEECYTKAKLVYMTLQQTKELNRDKYSQLLASLANVEFLRKNYSQSLKCYKDSLEYCSRQNEGFRNCLIGNMGLVQIYQGNVEGGKSTLQYVLSKVTEKEKKDNRNYNFFEKKLKELKQAQKQIPESTGEANSFKVN